MPVSLAFRFTGRLAGEAVQTHGLRSLLAATEAAEDNYIPTKALKCYNLPDPDELADGIIENLEAGLLAFK